MTEEVTSVFCSQRDQDTFQSQAQVPQTEKPPESKDSEAKEGAKVIDPDMD